MRSYISKDGYINLDHHWNIIMDKSSENVNLLDGKNYATWKVQVKMLLMKDELFSIVDGTEVAPTEQTVLRKFIARRDRASAILVLIINQNLLYIIGDPVDPKIVWEKLRDTYQKKSWANKLRLKRETVSRR